MELLKLGVVMSVFLFAVAAPAENLELKVQANVQNIQQLAQDIALSGDYLSETPVQQDFKERIGLLQLTTEDLSLKATAAKSDEATIDLLRQSVDALRKLEERVPSTKNSSQGQ